MSKMYCEEGSQGTLEQIRQQLAIKSPRRDILLTGFTALDHWLDGFKPGELVMIAGAPSMGKSELAINMISNQLSTNDTLSIAYFLGNKSELAVTQLLLACRAKVNPVSTRCNELSSTESKRLEYAISDFERNAPRFFGCPQSSMTEIIMAVISLNKIQKMDLLVIDLLQDIHIPDSPLGRQEALSHLKILAIALELPVVVLCSLFDGLEERESWVPTARDVKETVGSTQDVDKVILLYRDAVYNEESIEKGKARIIIAKNSDGDNTGLGCTKLRYDWNIPFYG